MMKKLSTLLLSLLFALGAGEGAVRLMRLPEVRAVHRQLDEVMNGFSTDANRRAYEPDSEAGFRPVLGGTVYGRHGSRHHNYPLAKRTGDQRILFLGDSVTFRGAIVRGLKERFGHQGFEYWNAGVEAYATLEEARYLRDHVQDLEFDHIVLTFHPNDMYSTPACFPINQREVAVHVPGLGGWRIDKVWAQRSHLYALAKGARLANVDFRQLPNARERCKEGLRIIQAEAVRRGARLTVLRFPFMMPPPQWDEVEVAAHALGGELCDELGIESYDLMPYFKQALADGFEDFQQSSGDYWHPSDKMGKRMALGLQADGLELSGLDLADSR